MHKVIVCAPAASWKQSLFQRPQQLMRQFARNGWVVIYCELIKNYKENVVEVEPNVFVTSDYRLAKEELRSPQPDVLYASWPKMHH